MKIARVFPTKTSMCPQDEDCYFGLPPLWTPPYDVVHISVTFTWDLSKVSSLISEWSRYGNVLVGGPALNDRGGEFEPGRYLRPGITITSRGCPKQCPWCFVPSREGKLRELQIQTGNIIQDNNLLACSKKHICKVFDMLRTQRQIQFKGGLDATLLKSWTVEVLRGLRIDEIWLSYDRPEAFKSLKKAVEKLKPYFSRDKIRCYVLIGFQGDTISAAESRLRQAWEVGTLPFAMRYRRYSEVWGGTYLFTERVWNLLTMQWSRPAIIRSMMQ